MEFDSQLNEMLATLEFPHDEARSWAKAVVRARLNAGCAETTVRLEEVRRQLSLIAGQREQLLNLRLSGDVTDEIFTRKKDELNERTAILNHQLTSHGQIYEEIEVMCQRAVDVFDVLSQDWLTMDRRARQLVLTALLGGFTLEERTLVPSNRTRLELFRAG